MAYVPEKLRFNEEKELKTFLSKKSDSSINDSLDAVVEIILAIDYFTYHSTKRTLVNLAEDIATIALKETFSRTKGKEKDEIRTIFKALRHAYLGNGPYETIRSFGRSFLLIYRNTLRR